MGVTGNDSLGVRRTLSVNGKNFDYFSLKAAEEKGVGSIARLPYSMKVLLENLLRYEDGRSVTADDVKAAASWDGTPNADDEIAFRPARVLLQDLTGVPAVVDLAAMREAMVKIGGDVQKINPLCPVDLVIDHSVMIDNFGTPDAFEKNVQLEFSRNQERYEFLRWGQNAFSNFRVVPPGMGICHQVNLEYLAKTIWTTEEDGATVAYPDTLVGTDSHTTMVNGLAVLGWGCGGIEAEAAMLGQPISMLLPEVIGFKLTGALTEGTTATDLVLTVTQMLRAKGVVSKFVEFYGPGVDNLSLPDRATIGNMAPEYGATCGFFPIDSETINFLNATGRDADQVALVEAYAKEQGMWRDANSPDPIFTDTLSLDISTVEPSLAGPRRPQDRVALSGMPENFAKELPSWDASKGEVAVEGMDYTMKDGHVAIAAITSCTNTSNPSVLMAAGLVARNAVAKGMKVKPWVKTSLAPGSQVVSDYLAAANLQDDLNALGFNIVGYGCTTCIGNSGPLIGPVADAIDEGNLVAGAVLSGNRNFEGRVHQQVKANYLASPPLVVAYALAGSLHVNLTTDALGEDADGNPVYLKDIWPSNQEIQDTIRACITPEMFRTRYDAIGDGSDEWNNMAVPQGETYAWNDGSTYVQYPPFFEGMEPEPAALNDIEGARVLLKMGDSVTTDHISPAGGFPKASPAGGFLLERQIRPEDFNSYGARRGNFEVMTRGTFANIRIRNEMVPGTEGGFTKHMPDGKEMSVYEASMQYQQDGIPLVVIAGKDYGMGSSRDWAAKGPNLLGIKAAIVESFERIHRSNLIGMGVLPLEFKDGMTRQSLNLDGTEIFDITGVAGGITPAMDVAVKITRADGSTEDITTKCRIDTLDEVEYYRHGGILQYVLRNIAEEAA
ncbi:MAG: aconitate hydratase AcnA [Alphaproteobacteria bacterium]|nr:aconitate hydratase AcnA [Alphaproteobacteria bacterium]